MNNSPLYLPKGSVRALVFLSIIATICFLSIRQFPIPEIIQDITIAVIAYYFGSKTKKEDVK